MKRRATAVALVLFLALQYMSLPLAFAQEGMPAQKQEVNADGSITITQTFPADKEPSVLPVAINQGGQRYVLDNTETTEDSSGERHQQEITETVFSQVPLEGINSLSDYFPATVYINEDSYQGEIGLNPAAPYTVVNRYEAFSRQVDRVVSFPNLPDNDVSRLPAQQDFVVSSAASPGATQWRTLTYTDVQYSIVGTDHLGLPNNYTAVVTYRGQEEYLELAFYDVTANYSGALEQSSAVLILTGTYLLEPLAAPVPPAPVTMIQENIPALPESGIPLFPLAIAGTTTVVILALPLLYFFFLANARFIRVIEVEGKRKSAASDNKKKDKTKIICRRRLVLGGDGVATLKIPSDVDILDGALYCLIIKPRLAEREGTVEMVWQNKIMAAMPLDRQIEINFKQLYIASAEAALIEAGLLD